MAKASKHPYDANASEVKMAYDDMTIAKLEYLQAVNARNIKN